jgi:hypothetical protein
MLIASRLYKKHSFNTSTRMRVLRERSIHLHRARALSTPMLAKQLLEHHLNAATPIIST